MYRPRRLVVTNLLSWKKVEYEFKQGVPQLIIGQNLDDPGQERNGTGKSVLVESISFAITGSFLRKIKKQETIFTGEQELSVEFYLDNTRTNIPLYIKRTQFKGGKSDECIVKLGDTKIESVARVTDYSKWILDEIGISEDDFFSFYLLTMEGKHYQPFLSLTDTPMKSIINRFSGAHKVDGVEPYIDKDSKDKENEIFKLEAQLSLLLTKIDFFNSQIKEINEKDLSIEKVEKLEKYKSSIDTYKLEIDLLLKREETSREDISNIQSNLVKFKESKKDYSSFIEEETTTVSQILEEIKKFEDRGVKVEAKYQGTIKEQQLVVIEFETAKKEFQDEKRTLEKEFSSLEKKIQDSIECPKCHHNFILRDDNFDVIKAVEIDLPVLEEKIKVLVLTIQETDKEVLVLQKEIESIKDIITKEKDTLRTEITAKRNDISSINQKINTFNTLAKEQDNQLKTLLSNLTSKETILEDLKKQIESKGNLLKSEEEKYNSLERETIEREKTDKIELEVSELQEKYEEVKFSKEELVIQKQEIDSWKLRFKSFKSELANKSIKNISDFTTLYLQAMGTNLSINIEGYRQLADGKLKEEIQTTILRDGFEIGSYGRFSRGERARIDVSNVLGMQELVNINAKNGLELLVIDEVLDCCDELGLRLILESLMKLDKTVIIISQISINSLKQNTLVCVKEKGETTLCPQL